VLVIIGIVTVVICLCRRKKKNNSPDNNETNVVNQENNITEDTDVSNITLMPNQSGPSGPPIFEYEYEPESKNPKIKILFVTTSQQKVQITINPEKKISELIKFYFEKINKPNLYCDKSIRFLINAKLIVHDSNDSIKS